MSSFPEWADQQLSSDLNKLRRLGESQEIEYIVNFPEQARDLGKEIAAFATSNTGTIVLGILDDGQLVGLQAETSAARDAFFRRIEGICRTIVKPSITPKVSWAIESSKIALIISVPKGSEPVYYCNGTPYVRHLTEARPAEPHEVIEAVRKYLGTRLGGKDEQPKDELELYFQLGQILGTALLWSDTPSEERNQNPWLQEWRTDCQQAAAELFDLTTKEVTVRLGLEGKLRELANTLDQVANHRLYMGVGGQLDALSAEAGRLARRLKIDVLDRIGLTEEAKQTILDLIRETAKKLSDLLARSSSLVSTGRAEELKETASDLGRWLLRLGYTYNLEFLGENIPKLLHDLGMKLHRIGAMRFYMDGGRSLQNVVDMVNQADSEMGQLLLFLSRF